MVARSAAFDATVADLRARAQEATERMARAAGAPAAVASVGLPSTSWEMLSLMRASGARDPRPTLGGGVLTEQSRWGPLAGRSAPPASDETGDRAALPVVAELHRRLGPIAVAANAGAAKGSKADKPTTTKHIPPRSLALALVDLLTGAGATDAKVAAKLDGLAGTPIHSTLVSMWTSASGNLKAFGDELEGWFDAEMARLTGLYKRLMRWVLGVAAVLVALARQPRPDRVDEGLWRDPDRRAEFVVAGSRSLRTAPTTRPPRATRARRRSSPCWMRPVGRPASTGTTPRPRRGRDGDAGPGDEVPSPPRPTSGSATA